MNKFEIKGLHHLALVCKDMERTVDFYTNILGMPLTKGFDLQGYGQHFFFDMGNGSELGFFWFNDAPASQPGVASAKNIVGSAAGNITSAHGSMNHLAFNIDPVKIAGYREDMACAYGFTSASRKAAGQCSLVQLPYCTYYTIPY